MATSWLFIVIRQAPLPFDAWDVQNTGTVVLLFPFWVNWDVRISRLCIPSLEFQLMSCTAGLRTIPKVMSQPELIYFNGPGRAQVTRHAFKVGEVQYTDTRHEMADWPAVKTDPTSVPAQLFGSMPCIKHGDVILAQSQALCVYAAELGIYAQGVLGDNAAVNRAIDVMVLGAHEDLQAAMYGCLFGDDDKKAKATEGLAAKVTPILAGLERVLERKSTDGAFFFSQTKPSLADLCVYDNFKSPFPGLEALGVDLSGFPKLNAVVDAVAPSVE
jgi:hypothetical protein